MHGYQESIQLILKNNKIFKNIDIPHIDIELKIDKDKNYISHCESKVIRPRYKHLPLVNLAKTPGIREDPANYLHH